MSGCYDWRLSTHLYFRAKFTWKWTVARRFRSGSCLCRDGNVHVGIRKHKNVHDSHVWQCYWNNMYFVRYGMVQRWTKVLESWKGYYMSFEMGESQAIVSSHEDFLNVFIIFTDNVRIKLVHICFSKWHPIYWKISYFCQLRTHLRCPRFQHVYVWLIEYVSAVQVS